MTCMNEAQGFIDEGAQMKKSVKNIMKRRNLVILVIAEATFLSLAAYGKTGTIFEAQAGVEQSAPAEAAHVPMNITGCDTFAQIVDQLQSGQGYAYASINGEDVLLITDHTFDNIDQIASIDADLYHYADGGPAYMGHVSAGGTAYPLAIADGKLFACGNHCVHKYTVRDGSLKADQVASVHYHVGGDSEYFVTSEVRDIATGPDGRVEDDSYLSALYEEYAQGKIIEFRTIQ